MGSDPASERNDGDKAKASGQGPASERAEVGTALIPFVPATATAPVFRFHHGVWAAGFLLAIGAGAFGVQSIRSSAASSMMAQKAADPDATAQVLHRLQDEIGRLKGSVDTLRTTADASKQEDTIRGLKKSVEGLRQEIEQSRANDGATLAQLSSKLDKPERDPSQKLAEIMARLDKLDRDPKDKTPDASQKLADVTNRLDRIERQVASPTPTGTIPVAPPPRPVTAPQRTASTAQAAAAYVPLPTKQDSVVSSTKSQATKTPPKPDVSVVAANDPRALPMKPPTVDGWVVRDVYDGLALVEARRGGLREIAPGEFLPGAGEIRSIERRGRSWVVLTSRGVIENSTW
ncbi:hypothetical protein [Lichenihabitans psoromatis]|uniref:hypothetical protein n=1 Tax=Lichenihabitans psoromatis TaxID=2528642 RepID=UPI0010364943|nr:hypothetical protein [Lichenihabitans psoromatis]